MLCKRIRHYFRTEALLLVFAVSAITRRSICYGGKGDTAMGDGRLCAAPWEMLRLPLGGILYTPWQILR